MFCIQQGIVLPLSIFYISGILMSIFYLCNALPFFINLLISICLLHISNLVVMSVCLSVCLSVFLSTCLSPYPSVMSTSLSSFSPLQFSLPRLRCQNWMPSVLGDTPLTLHLCLHIAGVGGYWLSGPDLWLNFFLTRVLLTSFLSLVLRGSVVPCDEGWCKIGARMEDLWRWSEWGKNMPNPEGK